MITNKAYVDIQVFIETRLQFAQEYGKNELCNPSNIDSHSAKPASDKDDYR